MEFDINIDKINEIANIELLAKQLVEGFITGLHKSPYHGFSVEFAEHRLYNYGESTRHIDWKVFAKTDRLYTKRYEEETNLRCAIVLDNSSSMYYPQPNNGKIKFAILASAALAYLLQKQRDAVGLFTFSDKIELQTEIKSTSTHVHKLMLELQRLLQHTEQRKKTNVADVLHQIAEKVHKRSLVIIFSDMLQSTDDQEEVFSALQHLKHNKHEVLLFHVHDRDTELDFNFEDRPYQFHDLESGQVLKLTPTAIKDAYHQRMSDLFKELFLKCTQLKIDLVDADVRNGFDTILTSYLIKRSKMK